MLCFFENSNLILEGRRLLSLQRSTAKSRTARVPICCGTPLERPEKKKNNNNDKKNGSTPPLIVDRMSATPHDGVRGEFRARITIVLFCRRSHTYYTTV